MLSLGLFTQCSQVEDILYDIGKEGDRRAPVYVDLPGDDLFPEGIIAAENGDLYVTGFGNGAILRITDGEHVEVFKQPGEDGLSSAVGMGIDEARQRLWVANFFFDTFSSNLKVFDLASGELLATLTTGEEGAGSFFNEIAVDAKGRVYISDTATPSIWTADADLSGVELFVRDSLLDNPNRPFGLNGLSLTPKGNYLIASVMDRISPGGGRLVRIGLDDLSVTNVVLSGSGKTVATFGGSDGMFFEQG